MRRAERFYLWFNKLVFLPLYLRHQGKPEAVIEIGNGARFKVRVNTSDLLVIWEIWRGKVYDDLRLPIRDGDIIVDLGAHIGGFAVKAALQACNGMVYAYEPSGRNFDLLTDNRALNGLQNLHIENRAVSNRRGELPLFMPAGNSILGSLLQKTSSISESVQATTLPDVLAEHDLRQIDFLKVDVEGSEFDILFHHPDQTLPKVRCMVIEYHEFEAGQRNHKDLVTLLTSYGFTVTVEKGIFPQPRWFGTRISRIGILKAWRE